jgi:hypothetical protein
VLQSAGSQLIVPPQPSDTPPPHIAAAAHAALSVAGTQTGAARFVETTSQPFSPGEESPRLELSLQAMKVPDVPTIVARKGDAGPGCWKVLPGYGK